MTYHLSILPALDDNYIYVIDDGACAMVIDPGEADPVLAYLEDKDLTLSLIVNTHHHRDHCAGNGLLQERFPCPIAAPSNDADIYLSEENGALSWQGLTFQIIETPGHTLDHVVLVEQEQKWLFSGDTLFRLGCGRVFEGTHEQMHQSLEKIKALPDDLTVYCGHEYGLSNARFALSLDDQEPLRKAERDIQNHGSVPFHLGTEKTLNPFLKAETAEAFSHIRHAKDQF